MKRINMLKDIEINMLLINIEKCICHLQMFYGAVKVSVPSYICVTMYTSICYHMSAPNTLYMQICYGDFSCLVVYSMDYFFLACWNS